MASSGIVAFECANGTYDAVRRGRGCSSYMGHAVRNPFMHSQEEVAFGQSGGGVMRLGAFADYAKAWAISSLAMPASFLQ